ncbi:MAG TPA: hypothetical protein VMZ91_13895 [Candidatus Paceibacterota bacterium]|nr:hypothetical protein [Candidatus Paceibacterota bacterium]
MNLLDFAGEETRNNLVNKKSEILENKHQQAEALINEKAKNEVEQEIYKPERLEKIKFSESNKIFGQRKKVCFFITPEELIKLKEKFKVIEQFQEFRIASSEIDKFIGVVLNG